MQPVKTVACPRCGAPAAVSAENRWRPFCGERCRLIDLGEWASESFRVAGSEGEPAPDAQDDAEG